MDEEALSRVLKAVGDTTRRRILTLVVQEGALRVTTLASHFAMSLNSVSKHIKVLEDAGLVTRQTLGREHLIAAQLGALRTTEAWFRELESIWELRLRKLDEILTTKGQDHERT
jgi:DNA-binding transcriptional ArsR family regulator